MADKMLRVKESTAESIAEAIRHKNDIVGHYKLENITEPGIYKFQASSLDEDGSETEKSLPFYYTLSEEKKAEENDFCEVGFLKNSSDTGEYKTYIINDFNGYKTAQNIGNFSAGYNKPFYLAFQDMGGYLITQINLYLGHDYYGSKELFGSYDIDYIKNQIIQNGGSYNESLINEGVADWEPNTEIKLECQNVIKKAEKGITLEIIGKFWNTDTRIKISTFQGIESSTLSIPTERSGGVLFPEGAVNWYNRNPYNYDEKLVSHYKQYINGQFIQNTKINTSSIPLPEGIGDYDVYEINCQTNYHPYKYNYLSNMVDSQPSNKISFRNVISLGTTSGNNQSYNDSSVSGNLKRINSLSEYITGAWNIYYGKEISWAAGEYSYGGYYSPGITGYNPPFKYLIVKYTGDISTLRIENAYNGSATGDFRWFSENEAGTFRTIDGGIVPQIGDNTIAIIDLEKSGIDMSQNKWFSNFHLHAGGVTAGSVKIQGFYFAKEVPTIYKIGEQVEVTETETAADEESIVMTPSFKMVEPDDNIRWSGNYDSKKYKLYINDEEVEEDKYRPKKIKGEDFDDEIDKIPDTLSQLLEGKLTEYYNTKIKSVPAYMFMSNSAIERFYGPNVETIGSSAFASASNLIEVSFPKCTSINQYAFSWASKLITADFPLISSIPYYGFAYNYELQTLNLPEVKSIGYAAFQYCSALTDINLSKCERVEGYAFSGGYGISNVSLPECSSIGYAAFSGCGHLENLSIPKVSYIDGYAFAYCYSLSGKLNLPECSYIGYAAFSSPYILKEIYAPKLSSIGNYAFTYCYSLTSVYLPNVYSIGESAFYGHKLDKIDLPNCKYIYSSAFLPYDYFNSSVGLSQISAPNLSNIYPYALAYNHNLTEIDFPYCSNVSNYAFAYCQNISKITIGNSQNYTGLFSASSYTLSQYAFANMSFSSKYGLKEIHLPNCRYFSVSLYSVPNTLELFALPNCTSASSYYLNTIQNTASRVVFELGYSSLGTSEKGLASCCYKLSFPKCSIVNANAFSSTSKLQEITFNSNMLTSIGSNAFSHCSNLKVVKGTENLTQITSYAFAYCSNLSSINLDKVESIAIDGFYYCSNLKTLDLPECTTIGDYAFAGCYNLSSILTPKVTKISSYAFRQCSNLTEIIAPEVTTIGGSAFNSCYNLKKIIAPKCNSLGSYALSYCTALQEVDFGFTTWPSRINSTASGWNAFQYLSKVTGNNCTTIQSSAFISCYNLKIVEFPNFSGEFGSSCFQNCTNLESVIVGSSSFFGIIGSYAFENTRISQIDGHCSWIGDYAFRNCSSLKTVNLKIDEPYITNMTETFASCTNLETASFDCWDLANGYKTFKDCVNLTSLSLGATNGYNYGNGIFENCYKLQNITLSNGYRLFGSTVAIPVSIFKNCYELNFDGLLDTNIIQIIGQEAFMNCYKLSEFEFGEYDYYGSFPDIQSKAFYGCSSLMSLIIRNQLSICNLTSTDALEGTPIANRAGGYIYVPSYLYSDYLVASNWSNFADVIMSY